MVSLAAISVGRLIEIPRVSASGNIRRPRRIHPRAASSRSRKDPRLLPNEGQAPARAREGTLLPGPPSLRSTRPGDGIGHLSFEILEFFQEKLDSVEQNQASRVAKSGGRRAAQFK